MLSSLFKTTFVIKKKRLCVLRRYFKGWNFADNLEKIFI